VGAQELEESRKLGQDLFGKIGPESEDGLYAFLRNHLTEWDKALTGYKPLADTGNYPGKNEIDASSSLIDKLLAILDSYEFFQAFNGKKDKLVSTATNVQELKDFYTNQRPVWEKLRDVMTGVFKLNRQELEKDTTAQKALARMDEILSTKRPYAMIKEINDLIEKVKEVNDAAVEKRRESSIKIVEEQIDKVKEALDLFNAEPDVRNKALKPLQDIKKQIQEEDSIPAMSYLVDSAEEELENALDLIESSKKKKDDKTPTKPVKYIQPAKVSTKNYLETETDIDEFLDALKKELKSALLENVRIRIQ
jgi:hypothetical protein